MAAARVDEALARRVDLRRTGRIVALVGQIVPDVTVIRLGPGCACQPDCPPESGPAPSGSAASVLRTTWTSVGPFVSSFSL